GRPFLRSPVLTERDKELLVSGESILLGCSLATKRRTVAVERGRDSGNIRDVFCQRLLAIYMQIGKRRIGVVLVCQLGRGDVEMRQIGRSPPVAQTACRVKRTAFRIEGVADLVSDDGADRSVLGGRGRFCIEEGRLQNCCREVQRVL